MSTKRRRTGQSSSRSGAAREPPQEQQFLPQLLQQLLPELLEKENAAVLDKLPRDVWERIVDSIGRKDLFSFAMTCRYFRDLRQDAVAAANDSESRWETVMTTKLKTYSYIETTESDCIYPPSIEESKYPLVPLLLPPLFAFTDEALSCPVFYSGMLSVSADYVKWLFREASSTHCREAALAKGRRYDGVDWWYAAQGARYHGASEISWSLQPSGGTSTSSSGSEVKIRLASGAQKLAWQQPGQTAGIFCAIS